MKTENYTIRLGDIAVWRLVKGATRKHWNSSQSSVSAFQWTMRENAYCNCQATPLAAGGNKQNKRNKAQTQARNLKNELVTCKAQQKNWHLADSKCFLNCQTNKVDINFESCQQQQRQRPLAAAIRKDNISSFGLNVVAFQYHIYYGNCCCFFAKKHTKRSQSTKHSQQQQQAVIIENLMIIWKFKRIAK